MPQMAAAEFDLMARIEDGHWWYRSLRTLLHECLEDAGIDPAGLLLDVGCGTGGTLTALKARWPGLNVVGLDLDSRALDHCRQRGLNSLIRSRADAVPIRRGCARTIVCLDVLYFESISAPRALSGFFETLTPGGLLALNLPAFASLQGEHDRRVGITRRFRLGELHAMAAEAGFEVVSARYWNAALFMPLLVLRRLSALRSGEEPRSDLDRTPGWLNAPLEGLLRLERLLARVAAIPFGSSAFLLARKPCEAAASPHGRR